MTLEANIFANVLTIEELEAKVKSTASGVLSFFLEGCCIDSQPQVPQ